jgi:3-deoxy-D-manno-octulosonate 8-phosphate phosphatase (KDO 8-P phosphatase)
MLKQKLSSEILQKAKKVKLLLMDCDGVLTDGKLYFSKDGEELKVFNIKDGQGIVSWHKAGFLSGVITGRNSVMLEKRVEELGINYLKQGSKDKVKDLEEILSDSKLSIEEVAYIGDDISDIGLLKQVGFPIAVSDCADEILTEVLYLTKKNGGFGAVREVTDLLLNSM